MTKAHFITNYIAACLICSISVILFGQLFNKPELIVAAIIFVPLFVIIGFVIFLIVGKIARGLS